MYWSATPSRVHGLRLVELKMKVHPTSDVLELSELEAKMLLTSKSAGSTLGLATINTISERSVNLLRKLIESIELDAAAAVFEKGTTTDSVETFDDQPQDEVPGI